MKADRKLLFLVLLFLPIGKAAGQLQSLIIGGCVALPHSRPYMVSIQLNGTHSCGGTLVHKRWVLTAAHCYLNSSKGCISVVVGLHRQPVRNARVQVFTVAEFVRHPSYNSETMVHDIMLLKCSPVLRELDVKVMDSRMCNNSRYWHGEVTGTMMCIEGLEKGSAPCKGDSGGPVVCGKKAEVAGVLSFTGKSCVDVFKPAVATAVFKYKKWIKKNLL
ncbi:Granzyme M [Chelonia mydas]|uniref:Granzyme M n=1 Tax=Chelonia mydas TaxID=8469 RepID=M7B789_CHEMY|nr:Granzyme M [Chelonia mydas]